MRKIHLILIHCSDTGPGMDIGAAEIRRWHTDPKPKGRGWEDIGYHGVIRRDGALESGRPMSVAGAHCVGKNANSVGICLVGGRSESGKPESNFTPAQWATLERTVRDLIRRFPGAAVHGHNEFAAKACPCFDAAAWWAKVQAGT